MTRADLTRRYVKKIVAEIRRAFNYLDKYDEKLIRRFIKEQMDDLYYSLNESGAVRCQKDDNICWKKWKARDLHVPNE